MFPLSTVYAKTLPADEWQQLASGIHHQYSHPARETVTEVEFVTYFDQTEHREAFGLG